jgi:hypothetical protein
VRPNSGGQSLVGAILLSIITVVVFKQSRLPESEQQFGYGSQAGLMFFAILLGIFSVSMLIYSIITISREWKEL